MKREKGKERKRAGNGERIKMERMVRDGLPGREAGGRKEEKAGVSLLSSRDGC